MDKKKLFDKIYSVKVSSDEEDKKKINYNNTFQKNKQKSNQKTFFSKNNNFKPSKNNKFIKEKSLLVSGVINSPSQNKNAISSKIKNLNKEKEKIKAKNNYIKATPKKKKAPNDNNENNNKNEIKSNKYETIDSNKKFENDDGDGLVTSFERKPSELKSPETISEDSFTSSYEDDENKNTEVNKIIKEEINNSKEVKANSHIYTKLVENELIYIERENKIKNQEKGNNTEKNSKDINNKSKPNNNNSNNIKNKVIIEKEVKQKEKEKKKEKYRNIEIKTTTRQTTYAKSNNNKINNKIIESKNPSELIMNTERESTNSNNIIKINLNHNGENLPYIPVNQRKKLLVNKILLDSKIKNFTKTNSVNILESDLPLMESDKKNEKLLLSNTKNNEKKFYAIANTEEKNRYKKKHINKNYSKENNYKTNVTKLNLENLRFRASISNRKQNSTNIENKISNSLSQTLEISKEYVPKKRYIKEKKIEYSKEKINKKNSQFILKKNSALITKSNSNTLRLNIQDTNINNLDNSIKNQNNNIQKDALLTKAIYEPKKLGVIRLRSADRIGNTINYSNMSYDPNQFLNNKIKDVLLTVSTKNINNLKTSIDDIESDNINNKKINFEKTISKKSPRFMEKKFIDLNNSCSGLNYKNQAFNFGLSYPIFKSMNNIKNLNNIIYSSYDGGKEYYYSSNKAINNPLKFNKINDKNNGVSSLTNLINKNEKYFLNNVYERTSQNNNILNHNSSCEFGLNEPIKHQRSQTQLINLIGNNFLGPNIVQNSPTFNLNNSIRDINNINIHNLIPTNFNANDNLTQSNSSLSINFEDLIILEGFLKEIIISITKKELIENKCFDFWNYYYTSSIYGKLEKLFTNQLDSNEVRININYTLMSIMLCYDYSFEKDLYDKVYSTLSDILKLNYKNFILICEYILSKITKESIANIWVLKLCSIIRESNYNDYSQLIFNGYNMTIVERISYNTNIIVQNLRYLLKNFKSNKNDCLTSIFKKIREKTYEEINIFFRENILRIANMKGSILGSVFLQKNNKFRTLPAPYVRTKNNKEFSLVLDLDETLIYFKTKNTGEERGILRVRPGINEFLDEVGKYYELIIFTTATQEYADALIDAVEEDKIYFDHRLYREHAVIIDNDFVKDLTRIGRPLDKIIIVDNMPQNFRLQKENGIIIKAFWGEDKYDTALIDLIPILINIAKEGGDVRKSLVKYKDEIVKNVTSCISKGDI